MNSWKSCVFLLCWVIFLFSSTPLTGQTVQLEVEPNHSSLGFSIPIGGFTRVTGKFNDIAINLDYVNNDMAQSSVEAIIQVKSINTGIPARDEHLLSADFFDAEKYPTITFKSTKIFPFEDRFLAIGTFSMHGVTQEVVLPFKIVKADGNTLGIQIRTQLNRLDYGVAKDFKHTSMPDFLGEIIDVEIDFWTRKKKKE